MRWFAVVTFLLVTSMTPVMADSAARDKSATDTDSVPGTFVVLSYHEARDDVRDYPDPYAVDTAALVRQFAWLRGNGYTPVSVDEIVAARQGRKALPARAVLLSFDDAYLSFYTHVYPLLREFGFPAVLAVVGQWIDNPHSVSVAYGEKDSVPEASFPTWGQLREMADSGLVELASHTYDLHHGILANPQGNLQPAATARVFDAANGHYEDDSSWKARVGADLARNSKLIERETGHRPRTVVWPYGSYNDELIRMAAESGMTIALTLDDGANTPDIPLNALRRTLVEHNPALAEFFIELRGPRNPEPVRVVQVSLDDIYSTDPDRQERNLSALLDRIGTLKPTHVFLQATTDSSGGGFADAAYFPNRNLSLRGDLFNRVAWQLASRIDVKVYAVMPLGGLRLSQVKVAEIYEDLARYANFDGLVFDDTTLPDALDDISALEATRQIAKQVRAFRMPLKTVRTLTIDRSWSPVSGLLPDADKFEAFARNYDYVSLIMTPNTSPLVDPLGKLTAPDTYQGYGANNMDAWRKSIFMLRPDPGVSDRVAADTVARQMRALQLGGAISFGYFANDFLHNDFLLEKIAPTMSLRVYPQKMEIKER